MGMTPTGGESSTGIAAASGQRTRLRRVYAGSSGCRHDLPGIEDVPRVERLFQCAHGVDRLIAEFGLEVFLLALPDAVLAGAGAAHRLRAFDQAMHELLAAGHLLGVVDVADQRAVE